MIAALRGSFRRLGYIMTPGCLGESCIQCESFEHWQEFGPSIAEKPNSSDLSMAEICRHYFFLPTVIKLTTSPIIRLKKKPPIPDPNHGASWSWCEFSEKMRIRIFFCHCQNFQLWSIICFFKVPVDVQFDPETRILTVWISRWVQKWRIP